MIDAFSTTLPYAEEWRIIILKGFDNA